MHTENTITKCSKAKVINLHSILRKDSNYSPVGWVVLLILMVLFGIIPFSLFAETHSEKSPLEFDCRQLSVACRDVTPADYATANPDFRVIEARFGISANLTISESLIDLIVYRFTIPDGVELADYLPKTELGAETGSVVIGSGRVSQRGTEGAFEAGGNVGYKIPGIGIGMEASAKTSGKTQTRDEVKSDVQMSLLPKKQIIVSSGTEARGKRLYFELRPFSQITLKGEKEFACLLVVPKTWTGDCIMLECQATAKETNEVGVQQTLGIGLYRMGEQAANDKLRVEKLAKTMDTIKVNITAFSRLKTLLTSLVGRWQFIKFNGFKVDDKNGNLILEVSNEGSMTLRLSENGEKPLVIDCTYVADAPNVLTISFVNPGTKKEEISKILFSFEGNHLLLNRALIQPNKKVPWWDIMEIYVTFPPTPSSWIKIDNSATR